MRSISQITRAIWRNIMCDGRMQLVQPLVLLPGPLALIIGTFAPSRWIFFLAYVYLLLLVAAYSWVRVLGPRISLSRMVQGDTMQVGDTLAETWVVSNTAWLPLLWLEIIDETTLPGYAGRRVVAVGSGEEQSWEVLVRGVRRGVYQLGPYQARLGDPLGLFVYTWRDRATTPLVVYPPLVRLEQLVVAQGRRGGQARADLLQQFVTPNVGGLREYVAGDSLTTVHWASVARTGRLLVKQFDQEQAGAMWIVLDLCQASFASIADTLVDVREQVQEYTQTSAIDAPTTELRAATPVDLAITLACSLAAQALAAHRMVGLLANDGQQRRVMPGRGARQLWEIQRALVDAEPNGAVPLDTLLAGLRHEAGASMVAVVTSDIGGEWLPRLVARRHHAQPSARALLIAGQPMMAAPLVAQLAAQGVQAAVIGVDASLPLLYPPRQPQTMRVSPFGRVMRAEP